MEAKKKNTQTPNVNAEPQCIEQAWQTCRFTEAKHQHG
jgi:hypothetical protein